MFAKETFFATKVIKFFREIYAKIVFDLRKDGIAMPNIFRYGKNSLVVNLEGEIDQYAAAELKEEIDLEIESSPKKNLIFNLANVSLMDSSGIGLIVGRYKIVTCLGGKMALCGATDNVEKMIKLSGIEKVLKLYKNTAEAEKSLAVK